jgi:hypothetical protein
VVNRDDEEGKLDFSLTGSIVFFILGPISSADVNEFRL